jgi:hypothetical protein
VVEIRIFILDLQEVRMTAQGAGLEILYIVEIEIMISLG